jgi:hypothetical protein
MCVRSERMAKTRAGNYRMLSRIPRVTSDSDQRFDRFALGEQHRAIELVVDFCLGIDA